MLDKNNFFKKDIEALEVKLGVNITKSDDVISMKDVLKRWDISDAELWDLIEDGVLNLVDPIGSEIKDFKDIEIRLLRYPYYEELGWYLLLSDIESMEVENPDLLSEKNLYKALF